MEEKKVEVSRCDHCPFATAQGRYYCVLAARNCIVPEIIPAWCPLLKYKSYTVALDSKIAQVEAA